MFKFMDRVRLQTKLQLAVMMIVFVAVTLSAGLSIYNIYSKALKLGQSLAETSASGVAEVLDLYHRASKYRLEAVLDILESQVDIESFSPSFDKDNAVVDRMRERYDTSATYFYFTDKGFERISTNLVQDGKRMTGTAIDSGPVFEALKAGRPHQGVSMLGGIYRIVEYRPLKKNGQVVGAVFAGKRIFSQDFIDYLKTVTVNGKGYPFILDGQGNFAYHPDPGFNGKPSSQVSTVADQLMSNKEKFLTYETRGQHKVAAMEEFPEYGWKIYFGMTRDETLHGLDWVVYKSSLLGLGLAMVGSFLSLVLLVSRVLLDPVKRIAHASEQIAKGEYDVSIDYEAPDALGETADSVRRLALTVKEKIGFIQGVLDSIKSPNIICDTAGKVLQINREMVEFLGAGGTPESWKGRTAGDLIFGDPNRKAVIQQVIEERTARIGYQSDVTSRSGEVRHVRIDAVPLYDLDGHLIGGCSVWTDMTEVVRSHREAEDNQKRLLDVARDIDAFTQHVAAASDQLAAQIEQASRGTENQRDRTASTATAMEEMNATVMEVARHASEAADGARDVQEKSAHGAQVVQEVVSAMGRVSTMSRELSGEINELGRQAADITSIINVIQDIADQTNLLALNAAIEAARAGEAGRGFAVVADEVRKLAERTMSATSEVTGSIQAITGTVDKNVRSVNQAVSAIEESNRLASQAGDSLEEILGIAGKAVDQITSIATAAEQQSATSEEINRSVDEINAIASETAEGMNHSAQAVSDLARQVTDLKGLVERMGAPGRKELAQAGLARP
ncbi:methyl-accepting chemotaxis protein [Fundidesulfovibrio terrae]|uniref:methyl-accepting chemotaxis protein n=1 Tax=Fundidesulfovibrio terrae TaxID=2922866 RepID=UPI001FAEA758|nr:methyl-accepting chemotaxis protein [Fundidesulfovibrio terrae]